MLIYAGRYPSGNPMYCFDGKLVYQGRYPSGDPMYNIAP